MKPIVTLISAIVLLNFYAAAQDVSLNQTQNDTSFANVKKLNEPEVLKNPDEKSFVSPYKTSLKKDGIIMGSAVLTTLLGYELIKNKNPLTMAQLAEKTKDKLPFFDRGNAGYYSKQANDDSYILFYGAYALPPLMMLINKNERQKFGQLAALYVETITITGSMYTLAAGLVYRSRPFVYGNKAELDRRLSKGGQRSFYGGHVATCAAASFFAAKVFADFNPESKAKPYVWAGAAILPAAMGYLRYKAGYHFLSDCTLAYIIGGATGILIPKWHTNKMMKNFSVVPTGEKGLGLVYHL